jgi:predicted PolB exonuclease-like 3'-5' exonuclease
MDDYLSKYIKNILFLDIETVSQKSDFQFLDERTKTHWLRKTNFLKNEENLSEDEFYFDRAGIYAEFGKIICISFGGIIFNDDNQLSLRVKTIGGDNEAEVLEQFKKIIEKHKAGNNLSLCAHNGREFDFPFLCRRMLINGIALPNILQFAGKKPWEINHIDTLDLWKFGDYKHYTSLDLLATIFDIPSSKSEIDGSQVNEVYYKEKDLKKIMKYCGQDVIVLAQLFMKLNHLPLINDENIEVL